MSEENFCVCYWVSGNSAWGEGRRIHSDNFLQIRFSFSEDLLTFPKPPMRVAFYQPKNRDILLSFGFAVAAVVSVAACYAQSCAPPPPGMVGWWPGDGNANDIIGNSTASELVGVAAVSSKVSKGFQFGPESYLFIPQSPALEGQRFTWTAWVRPDGPSSNNDRNGGVIVNGHFKNEAPGKVFVQLSWSSASERFVFIYGEDSSDFILSHHTFAPGVFHLVTGTFDGRMLRLYIDGALEGSLSHTRIFSYAGDWHVGGHDPKTSTRFPRTWNGVIDELQAYDRALSEAEILSIYQAGSEGVCKTESQRQAASVPDSRLLGGSGNALPKAITRKPSVITQIRPDYSETGRLLRAQGSVLISLVVLPNGTASDLKVVRSLGYGLDERAMDFIRRWRFQPGMKEGIAVPVQTTIETNFSAGRPAGESNVWYSGQMIFAPGNDRNPRVVSGKMPEPGTEHGDDSVVLEFGVTPGGAVTNVHPLHGSPAAFESLSLYLESWTFQPAIHDGRSVEAVGRVRFTRGNGDADASRPLEAPAIGAARTLSTSALPSGAEPLQAHPPDAEGWAAIRDSSSIQLFEAFLKEYPNSQFAGAARLKIAALRRSQP